MKVEPEKPPGRYETKVKLG